MSARQKCYAQGCVLCQALRERDATKSKVKAALPAQARARSGKAPAPSASLATEEERQVHRALSLSRETASREAQGRGSQAHAEQRGGLSAAQYQALMRDLQTREITPEDYDLLLRLDESVQKKNVLAAEGVSKVWAEQAANPDCGCAICCNNLEDGEVMAVLCCGHVYHPGCIREWLTMGKDTCPMCGTQQCSVACDE